jgi:predicted polyphosphate/ATP-dependent NAD kinase
MSTVRNVHDELEDEAAILAMSDGQYRLRQDRMMRQLLEQARLTNGRVTALEHRENERAILEARLMGKAEATAETYISRAQMAKIGTLLGLIAAGIGIAAGIAGDLL